MITGISHGKVKFMVRSSFGIDGGLVLSTSLHIEYQSSKADWRYMISANWPDFQANPSQINQSKLKTSAVASPKVKIILLPRKSFCHKTNGPV
jgi:hypothetical protein